MAITEDASTPLVVTKTGTTAPVTASFSPPAKSLLVALIAGGYGSAAMTATVTDSGGHVWSAVPSAVGTTSNRGIAQIYYTYLTTAPGSITVSGAFTNLSGGSLLSVRVLNGASPDQLSAAKASVVQTGSTTGTVSITTTVTGSQVYGISDDPDTAAALTLNGSTSLVTTGPPSADFNNTTDSVRCVGWKATSATGTPGATTLGGTWAVSAASCTVALEVLPVQLGVIEDPSTPAVVAQTGNANSVTAAFSPPANSQLFALVAIAKGNNLPTITDSGGHTWNYLGSATGFAAHTCIAAAFVCQLTTAPGSITVTAAYSTPNITGGTMLAVRVLTGADPALYSGSLTLQTNTSSTVGSCTAIPILPGSRIYGMSVNPDNTSAFTVNNSTTAIRSVTDLTDTDAFTVFRSVLLTPNAPVSTTVGGTWGTAHNGVTLTYEVVPSSGAASLVGTAALTADGSTAVSYAGSTALSAVATLAPTATRTTSGAGTLPATASLTTDGTKVQTVATTLTGTSTMIDAGTRITSTAATLAASANLTAPAFFTISGAVALTGLAALAPAGVRNQPGAVTLTSVSTLTAAGVPGTSVVLPAVAVFTSTIGVQSLAAFIALSGAATFGGPAFLLEPSAVNLFGTATLTGQMLVLGDVALVATSVLSGDVFLTQSAAVTFQALSALTDAAYQTVQAQAALPAVSVLTITGPFLAVGGTGATLLAGSILVASATAFQPALAPFVPLLVVTATAPTGTESRKPTYRLYAANTRTGRIGWELPVANASWNTPINAAGTLRATLAIEATLDHLYTQGANDPRTALREVLTGPYLNSLVLTYGDTAVFAGPYLPASVPADKPTIDIGGAELVAIFEKRILYTPGGVALANPESDLYLGPSSQGELIRSIIVAATSGTGRELPITCSNPPNAVGNAQITYYGFNLTTAGSALSQIASQGIGAPGQLTVTPGPDFRLDPYLVTGSDGLYVKWELRIGNPYLNSGIQPWSFDDATSMVSQEIDASKMASTYYVPGSGQDRQKLISTATDTSLIDAGFPMLEEVDGSYSSEFNPVLLDSYAAADVARYVSPVDKWIIQTRVEQIPRLGSYRVGDPIIIDVQRHPVIQPGIYPRRITEISGDVSNMVAVSSADTLAKKYS